jgi:TolB-like protein
VAYVFGDHRLDVERRELWRGDELLALEPQVFDLLAYLVRHRDRVIGKDELFSAVWGGRIVSDSALTTRLNATRRVLGDSGERQDLIRTLPRKGVRFVAEVKEVPDGSRSPAAAATAAGLGPTLVLPDRPSIAVMPFANLSGDPEQEYFADGMVEEIITALSRIRWLFVIARNSTFTYKGQTVDVKQLGRELGVRYVLEGSVRKAGGRARITALLIDSNSGAHLWADRFDGSLEEVFDLQDRVALSVAGFIEPALQAAEMRRSAARPTTDLGAYDLYLRALAAFYPVSKERALEALGLFEQAIAIDRHYGPALSWAAICHMRLVNDGWAEEAEATSRRKAVDLARQALEAAPNDPGILANSAFVLGYFGEDIGAMSGLVDRALALNPSLARGWFVSGIIRLWAGQPDLAIEHVQTSLRLSPRERMGTHMSTMGVAYFFKHRFDKAATTLRLSIQDHPGLPTSYRFLAACYAHMGRLDEARAIVARLRVITPLVVPDDTPYRNLEDRELYLSGLRLAADKL